MYRTYKIRIMPTDEQIALFNQYVGATRFIWNYFLEIQNALYKNNEKYLSAAKMGLKLKELKEEFVWLRDISHHTLVGAVRELDFAFQQFFKGITNPPKFKCKRNDTQSFYARNDRFYVKSCNELHLDKIGTVSVKHLDKHLKIGRTEKYKTVRVLCKNSKWYVYVSCECESQATLSTQGIMGIDVGVRHFVTAYQDKKYVVLDYITSNERYKFLKRKQNYLLKCFWRKVRKHTDVVSKRQQRYKRLLNRVTHRLQGLRRESLFTICNTLLANNLATIIVEHLDLQEMHQSDSKYLRTQLSETPLYLFKQMLRSKCEERGIDLREVPVRFPSSRRCSNCGYVYPHSIGSVHMYECPSCRMSLDRDKNAARNLCSALQKSVSIM